MAEMSDGYLNKATIFQQAVSSCFGAVITSLLGKRFVYKNGLTDHICLCENGDSQAWYKKLGHFKGTMDAFVKSIQREGIKSLWSGLPPALIRALSTAVIYFTCCDQLSEALKSRLGKEYECIPVLAGSLSRSMYWYNYDYFKRMMCKEAGVHEPTFLIAFASGAASGSRECPSAWVVMRKIVAKNGISGLFTGIIPWLCRVAPACAIMISTYEYGKSFFSHVNEKINQCP